MAKVVDADPRSYRCTSSGITGQKSLRNQNRRKKRMLTAEVPNEHGPKEGQPYRNRRAGHTIRTWLSNLPSTQRRTALSLLEGNVVKYITRWKLKGQPLSDLEKAKHCIDLLIEIHNVK